jgi:hypothetical protein
VISVLLASETYRSDLGEIHGQEQQLVSEGS